MLFDVVIPHGPKDDNKINLTVEYIKKNVIGFRNIYIISYNKNLYIHDCITIDENIFTFKNDVNHIKFNHINSNGWCLQQLIKLYASFFIKEMLETYLVIDCDTFFINKTSFFDENDLPLYNYGSEYYIDYFHHMNKLHPSLIRYDKEMSGITHHMIFQKEILKDLFDLVESYHGNKKPFYKIFLENINTAVNSSMSEYEIYFNYLCIYKQNKFKIRKLNYIDTNYNYFKNNYLNNNYYNYICCHWWK